jgi:hypothetical protein
MEVYRLVEKHGAESILGRPLTPREAREMHVANRIESAYYSRQRAIDEATWANADPGGFKLLQWAEGIAKNG